MYNEFLKLADVKTIWPALALALRVLQGWLMMSCKLQQSTSCIATQPPRPCNGQQHVFIFTACILQPYSGGNSTTQNQDSFLFLTLRMCHSLAVDCILSLASKDVTLMSEAWRGFTMSQSKKRAQPSIGPPQPAASKVLFLICARISSSLIKHPNRLSAVNLFLEDHSEALLELV